MSFRALLIPIAVLFPVAALAQEGDAAAGKIVFTKCGICHVAETDTNKVGPSLNGVFGRTAGTHPNFSYSPAMQAAGSGELAAARWLDAEDATMGHGYLVWDETTLRDYLHDPKAKVKGTKMTFVGLKDDTQITNLFAYLKQYSK